VVLFPGDIIQLGASSRVYVLDGPKEFDRGAVKASQQQALLLFKSQQGASTSGKESSTEEASSSWGMNFDDVDNNNDKESTIQKDSQLAVNIADVPNQHRKLYESIEAKKYKLANIQLEMQRIQNKASSEELTNGQSKQLESLEKREKDLLQQLSELEMNLREKMDSSGGHSPAKRGRHVDEDDVDDFYDRTCPKRAKMNEEQHTAAETATSLMERCKTLFVAWKAGKTKSEMLKKKVDGIEQRLQSTGQADEDFFFIKNDLDLAMDEYMAAVTSVQSVVEEIDEVEKLLRIVNDKIIIDRELAFVGDEAKHRALVDSQNEQVAGSKVAASSNDEMVMPPTRIMPEVIPMEQFAMPPPVALPIRTVVSTFQSPMPPPIPKATTGTVPEISKPKIVDVKAPQPSTEKAMPSERKIRGPERPAQGTLSFISADAKKGAAQKNGEKKTMKYASKPSTSINGFDSKKDEWVAPKGQDGSGITKLNAKFQGRY
jgi:hypothetical protein